MGLLSENAYEAAPSDLKLEQVHVYIRHGERTPVGIRMSEPPANIPAFWNLCKTARRFKAAVMGENNITEEAEIVRLSERGDGYAQEGECLPGELTDVGRKSTLRVGQELRKLYVERLGLLPEVLDSHKTAYFRLAELALAFNLAAAKDNNPNLERLDSKLSKYIGGNPIRIDGRPRLSGILDTIRAADAHGFRIPPEFKDPNTVEIMVCLVKLTSPPPSRTHEFNLGNGHKDGEFRRLAMGRLLAEMSGGMSAIVDRTEAPKIRVLACHDTTLAGLCQTLDVFNNR
ncbi:hypothetical protein BN14_03536 [Rhizoctonia solani AG-1 IB]|uniref:Uncharacterized protein n=1 Tax=Thanatephorus cucumeris (strain AG1-IB / isolate 7/3/14) TaxID=1108050 RepID=M5C0W8_THACB|nr:hypothetical protein BN14_03536 [Rhizoctonia solani AG-1 IB]